MNRTCNVCGYVAYGTTRAAAEAGVAEFNRFYDNAPPGIRENYGRPATIKEYERCLCCGNDYTHFRDSVEGDCPPGCTLSPIIVEEAE